jgi:tRNA G18 (ribose-2'-O)-methylase SpoU
LGGHFALRVVSTPLDARLLDSFPGSVMAMEREGGISLFAVRYAEDCAFLLGNEGSGLSPEAVALAGSKVTIPMAGRVESLNVAAAGAVICFEVLRQKLG